MGLSEIRVFECFCVCLSILCEWNIETIYYNAYRHVCVPTVYRERKKGGKRLYVKSVAPLLCCSSELVTRCSHTDYREQKGSLGIRWKLLGVGFNNKYKFVTQMGSKVSKSWFVF